MSMIQMSVKDLEDLLNEQIELCANKALRNATDYINEDGTYLDKYAKEELERVIRRSEKPETFKILSKYVPTKLN